MKTTALALALALSQYIPAQHSIYITNKGALANVEGNFTRKGSSISQNANTDDIDSITFRKNKMNLYQHGSVLPFDVMQIDKVSTAGPIHSLPLWYPESLNSLFDFETDNLSVNNTPAAPSETVITQADQDGFLDFTENHTWSHRVTITYSSSSAIVSGETEGLTVSTTGAHVTIESTVEGVEYTITGNSSNGSLLLKGNKNAKIILSGIHLTNTAGAALSAFNTERTFITTAKGTDNVLSDASTRTETDTAIGCIFSSGRLLINGEGRLYVTARYKQGISSSTVLRLSGGFVQVTADAEAGSALQATQQVIIGGGTLHIMAQATAAKGIYSGKDVMMGGGETDIITTGDGDQADDKLGDTSAEGIFAKENVTVNGGRLRIKTTGGLGAVGIAAMKQITIHDGTILAACYDDGFNAVDGITVSGGQIFVTSAADDGMDSNGFLSFSGGTTFVIGPRPNESPFDNDGKTFSVTGGTLIGLGIKTDRPQASVTKQHSLYCSGLTADRYVCIRDAEGNNVISFFTPPYEQMVMTVSSPKFAAGTDYTLFTSHSLTSGSEHWGIVDNPQFSSCSQVSHFTFSSMITEVKLSE